jgi:hypothetical protein
MRLCAFSILIVPEYPAGKGVTSATSFALSMVCPFSSEKVQSSAKYFFQGAWLPGTIASQSSCVRLTNSSCVMGSPGAAARAQSKRRRTAIKTEATFIHDRNSSERTEKPKVRKVSDEATSNGQSRIAFSRHLRHDQLIVCPQPPLASLWSGMVRRF